MKKYVVFNTENSIYVDCQSYFFLSFSAESAEVSHLGFKYSQDFSSWYLSLLEGEKTFMQSSLFSKTMGKWLESEFVTAPGQVINSNLQKHTEQKCFDFLFITVLYYIDSGFHVPEVYSISLLS